MIYRIIHTKNPNPGKIKSSPKIAISLVISLLLFFSLSLNAQVINNKGAVISVTGGTVVDGHTIENTEDSITNDGVINLSGDYINLNLGTTSGIGTFNIGGNWTNTGVFTPDTGTVHFNGFNLQTITRMGGETFYNLSINNTGANPVNRIIISDNVTVTNSLTLDSGNVFTGVANKLYLSNRSKESLKYLSNTGGRVIGKFERGLNSTGNYLFPIGSDAYYNPLNLNLNVTPTGGSFLSEFFKTDPGSAGLPVEDDSVEVYEQYPDGYWSLTPYEGFQSYNYDINMKGAGFSDTIHDIARVMRRDDGGDWELDGTHKDASESDSIGFRANLDDGFDGNGNGHHFAFGHSRPRIMEQPLDTSVCDGTPAWFEVEARGRKRITYQWQVDDGGGMVDISDGPVYTGTQTDRLDIPVAVIGMTGYQYRVIITHRHGHYNISDTVTLTVNPIPEAFATPDRQIICNTETTSIAITSDVPLSTFILQVLYSGNLSGWESFDLAGGNAINHTLTNPGSDLDSIIYRIIPFGPEYTYCEGIADTAVIFVNPTPTIIASTPDTIYCNGVEVFLEIENYQITTGTIKYNLNTTDTGDDFTGETSTASGWLPVNDDFSDSLSHAEPTIQELSYRFIPYIEDTYGMSHDCLGGIDTAVIVKMVPVLTGFAVPDTFIGGDNIRCFGLSDGKVELESVGGDYRSDYTFVWKNSLDNTIRTHLNNPIDSLLNQPAGPYTFSITDTIGCNVTGSFVLTEPEILAIEQTLHPPHCVGDTDGYIENVVTGGHLDYSYFWKNLNSSNFDSTLNILDAEIGQYIFQAFDINGCSDTVSSQLDDPDEVASQVTRRSRTLYAETYDIKCYGDSGYIEVAGTFGQAPFSYKWYKEGDLVTPIDTDNLLSDQPAGVYYYLVTDAYGCVDGDGLKPDTITQPDSIEIVKMNAPYPGEWDISCFGLSDGTLDLEYTGGHIHQFKNDFYWTGPGVNGHTDSIKVETLVAGEYSVKVTDKYGCNGTFIDTLEQPSQIEFSTVTRDYNGKDVSCYGIEDGEISFDTIFGGGTKTEDGIYSYSWRSADEFNFADPGAMDQIGLPADTYYIEIKDQIQCTRGTMIVLSQTDSLWATTIVDILGSKNGYDISCFGGNDGKISIIPDGGTSPYQYVWTGPGTVDGDPLQKDLIEGDYDVILRDLNNCEAFYSFQLESPPALFLNDSLGDLYCFGDLSTIYLTPGGGNIAVSGEYDYSWDTGSEDQDLENVPAGIYYVVVTDDNGCTIDSTYELVQNGEIIPTIHITSDYNGREISCHDSKDGILAVTIEGGMPAFTYRWSNGESGFDFIENLSTGYYSVEGEDQNDCPYFADTTIVAPPPLTLEIDAVDPLCYGIPTGEIKLFPDGGTPDENSPAYQFTWNSSSLTGDLLTNLPEGEYTLRMEDVNNCRIDTVITLVQPDSLYLEFETTMAECRDEPNGTITINYIDGGVPPYITKVNGYQDDFFDYLLPGVYVIVLTDFNGCIREDTAIVFPERESCLIVPNAFTPNGDGSNDTWILDEDEDGTSDMIYYPDAELRIYNRWGELIYYSSNVVDEPWDGTYKGRDMPIDSYHYILDFNNGDPPIKGNVTIIR